MARLIKYVSPELLNKFGKEIKNYIVKSDSGFDEKIDNVNATLNEKIDNINTSLDTKIDSTKEELSENIDSVNRTLSLVKQDKLSSGFNIKSINGESLLGAGDMKVVTDLTGYAKEDYVDEKVITEELARKEADSNLKDYTDTKVSELHIENYATKDYVDEHTPANYVKTASYIEDKISITKVVDGDEVTFTTDPLASKDFVTTKISELGSIFTIKGSKATVADLPTEGNNQGDVWYILEDGSTYVWVDVEGILQWRQLGLSIDLSIYATKSELADVAASIPSIEGLATEEYVNSEVARVEAEIPSIDHLATKDYVDTSIDNLHEVYQPLGDYANRSDLDDCITKTEALASGINTRSITINGVRIFTDGHGQLIFDASELYNKNHDILATKRDVQTAINNLIDSAPETLDTLAKIAEELKQGEGAIQAIMTAIDTKASKASLARVATTGDFNDLRNKPIIPTSETNVSYFHDDGTYVKAQSPIFNEFATKTWVKTQLTTVFKYKGKVQTFAELPTDAQNGDFWWVVEPKEEGKEGNMSYIWDGNSWSEFMPMGQGGGGGETSIIHVEELPSVDQELDKLYQVTTPKSFNDTYCRFNGMIFKNQFRDEGTIITVKVVEVNSLEILDPTPVFKEAYDNIEETSDITITVYKYDGKYYYFGSLFFEDGEGNTQSIAVGGPQPFDEEHPIYPYAHRFLGQEDIDLAIEQEDDLQLSAIQVEPWPEHLMFTLTVTDEDGNEQVCHLSTKQNEDPESNGDDPDEEAIKYWGLEGDNDFFLNEYGADYERWPIRVTDSTYVIDEVSGKWKVQYRVRLSWLLEEKGVSNIRLQADEENFTWYTGDIDDKDGVINFAGEVSGESEIQIGIPLEKDRIVSFEEFDSSECLWIGFDINWGEHVMSYASMEDEEPVWQPLYYYPLGHCAVPNEDGDIQEFDLRTYSKYKTTADNSYSLDKQLAISTDRRNNDVFECNGITYKLIDWIDEETGQVTAALVDTEDDEGYFEPATFEVTCDNAYIFQIDDSYTRKVKIPVTHAGEFIGANQLWGYDAIIKFVQNDENSYTLEWCDRSNPDHSFTSETTWTVEDGYAIFETWYLYDYPTTYSFDDIIVGLPIRPVVDDRIVIFHELTVPMYKSELPTEMGGGHGKASFVPFSSAVDLEWWDQLIQINVIDKIFFVDLYDSAMWILPVYTDINEMYMYDESKFRKLITEKDFEEATTNFITPDNIKDYVKISNFVYWDSDRSLPDIGDADANKFYIKNGAYYHANKQTWMWKTFDSVVNIPDSYSSLSDYFNRAGQYPQSDKLYALNKLKFRDSCLSPIFYYKAKNLWSYNARGAANSNGEEYKPLNVYFATWDANNGYPIPEERFVCSSSDSFYTVCVVDTQPGEWIDTSSDLNSRFKLYYLTSNNMWSWIEISIGSQIMSGPTYKGIIMDYGSLPEIPEDGSLYIQLIDTWQISTRIKHLYYYDSNMGKWFAFDNHEISPNTMESPENNTDNKTTEIIKQVQNLPENKAYLSENTIYHLIKPASSYIYDGRTWPIKSFSYGRQIEIIDEDSSSSAELRAYDTRDLGDVFKPYAIAYPFGRSTYSEDYLVGSHQGSYKELKLSYNLSRKSITFNQKTYVNDLNKKYVINQKDEGSFDGVYQYEFGNVYLPLCILDTWIDLHRNDIPETPNYEPTSDSEVLHLGFVKARDDNGVESTYDLSIFKYTYYDGFRLKLKSDLRTVYVNATNYNYTFRGYTYSLGYLCGPHRPEVTLVIDSSIGLGAFAFFDQKDWSNDPTWAMPYFYGNIQLNDNPFTNMDGQDKTLLLNIGMKQGELLFDIDGKSFYFMVIPGPWQREYPSPNTYCKLITDTTNEDEIFNQDGSYNYEHIYAANYISITQNSTQATAFTRGRDTTTKSTWEEEQELPVTNIETFVLYAYDSYARIPEGQVTIHYPYIVAGYINKPELVSDNQLIDPFKSTIIKKGYDYKLNTYVLNFDVSATNALCYHKHGRWTTIDISNNILNHIAFSRGLKVNNDKVIAIDTEAISKKLTPTIEATIPHYYKHNMNLQLTGSYNTWITYDSTYGNSYAHMSLDKNKLLDIMQDLLCKPLLINTGLEFVQGHILWINTREDGFDFGLSFMDGREEITGSNSTISIIQDSVKEIR